MKSIYTVLLCSLLMISGACGQTEKVTENEKDMETKETTFINATPDELAGIRKALDLYAEAAIKGDSSAPSAKDGRVECRQSKFPSASPLLL